MSYVDRTNVGMSYDYCLYISFPRQYGTNKLRR